MNNPTAVLSRSGVLAAVLLFAAVPVRAAPDTYAVAALIGDSLSIVTYQPATGSRLDSNARQQVETSDGRFDREAGALTIRAIRDTVPGATAQAITVADRAAYVDGDALIASDERLHALLQPLTEQLSASGARYLVLVTKHRGEARLKMQMTTIGSGQLDGLGFYLDREYRTRRSDNGAMGRGFIAPYAYINVSLVDVATGRVIRSESATEGYALSTARSETATLPWDALTGDQKVRALDVALRRALQAVVPHVVAPG